MTPDPRDDGPVPGQDWDRAARIISAADEVALACHVSPDGDALGSMLGVGLALRAAGKRVTASFGDRSFHVPRLLRFLPGQDLLIDPAHYPAVPEVMVTFDLPTVERLGTLAGNAAGARELIVLDHHPSNTGFGTLNLVDPGAAATAVLAEELIHRLGLPIDRDIATCLYVGLVTDTGSFRHSSTTPRAHAMAARLVACGLDPEELARELWDRSPFGYLKVLGTALDRVRLEPEVGGGLVWTFVTRADRAAHGLPYDEVEGIIDVVRRTDEADVAAILKEDDEGAWQVSTRSKGGVDVSRVCAELGGGGHARAAGFTSHLPVEETIASLRALL
ncbi:bifunctional oligoribonuclease/PAP phosphatase NrnA [Streptosporangium sp. NBC_01755]|uniref:DHH family phosphoesterase n=1 Tax=unclassified Streptosporangium TaxID=2632669 RepID=UPI002DD82D62|nr:MULTISPECIES: bifunctional oligoribonuclease/PAP phosphatase NrnA [unclassified Streptosporangium]WSA23495.1 bifunctional oligoribonuclease/PAP phosphatase NrnA [Streptosporangium sp. NBC_01810]WSC98297.1 bifunctional oligoribonuclease/PAP phosphatase NrnA [Streptosporangium sp. NBC_01755]